MRPFSKLLIPLRTLVGWEIFVCEEEVKERKGNAWKIVQALSRPGGTTRPGTNKSSPNKWTIGFDFRITSLCIRNFILPCKKRSATLIQVRSIF